MAYSKADAVSKAKADLAKRLGISESDIKEESIDEGDFPVGALGAPWKGAMSAMMISTGWRIRLGAGGKTYEYRADRNQLRLYNFKGANHRV
jgi:hypothetical protein